MSINGTVTFFSLQSLPFFFSPLSILIKWQDKSHFSVKQSESYSFRHKLCDSAQMRRAEGRRISSVAGCHLMDAERTVSPGWLCLQSYSPLTLGSVIQESLGKTLNSKLLWMTPGGTDHSEFSSLFIFVSQTDDTAGFQKFPMTKKRAWPNKKKTAELCNPFVWMKTLGQRKTLSYVTLGRSYHSC